MWNDTGNSDLAPSTRRVLNIAFMLAASLLLPASLCGQYPGFAHATSQGNGYTLKNKAVEVAFKVLDRHLCDVVFTDRLHAVVIPISSPFALLDKNGAIYTAADLIEVGAPQINRLAARPDASNFAERLTGEQIDIPLASTDGELHLTLSMVLRDGSAYLRQIVTITATGRDISLTRVNLLDLHLRGAHVVGSVKGSPIVAGDLFMGFEHPLSESNVTGDRATAWIDRELPLKSGQSITYSSVIGVARAGQMRRDFLTYIERERAHPYRTFLHYNSWYDLGYFTPYDEAGALDRINVFGHELHDKRGVVLDSFLFDDGWDNHNSLWQFNSGFPDGFIQVGKDTEKYGAYPGVWMSPWGGYSKPRQERLAYGKSAGFEIIGDGFALSGPKYYARFRDVCLEMIQNYGVNQFKFDGTGNVDSVFPGSAFDSDFSAAIHLIGELRQVKADIYINLTTGTWPSPFWLRYADSIWRGGEDDSVAGVGTYRERWITYRDADTYHRIVELGPLYPLNSLMLHGMIYAQFHKHLNQDPGNDFRNEIRSYFGTGTQLQEMYITPSLLTSANWDDLAEAAKWSRANADILKDTHWIGGDPSLLEVYGWASWGPREGILVLRNPSDKPQTISIDLAKAFELPRGAPEVYNAHSPWKDDRDTPALQLRARVKHPFHLAPFEVLTLDMFPQRSKSIHQSR